jgi:hypothetical protein
MTLTHLTWLLSQVTEITAGVQLGFRSWTRGLDLNHAIRVRIRMFLGLLDPDPLVREVWIRIRIILSSKQKW